MNSPILKHFKSLEVDPSISFSNIPRSQTQYLTHGYHRYPAKFIPTLAAHLIKKNTRKGDIVCDPFGGCGTTLVEAKIHERNSIGIDINPIAGLITRTKITPINPDILDLHVKSFIEKLKKSTDKKQYNPKGRMAYWFSEKNYSRLNIIFKRIEKIEDKKIRQFYQCAFSHILKNSSRWLMKSIKPTIDKDKVEADPIIQFERHLNFMVKKNKDFFKELNSLKSKTNTKFYLRDARNTKLPHDSIDYILTSPPYVTSYEYADLHQLSILWFESVDNWMEFKKSFVGTSYRKGKNKVLQSKIGEEIICKMVEHDKSLARNIRAYFEDMEEFISESKRILKKGKKLSLVIGDTSIKGVEIFNAEVAYEQMKNLGFRRLKVEKRQTSSQSITPYRDSQSGRFTSIDNPSKKRAYQFEFIITGLK